MVLRLRINIKEVNGASVFTQGGFGRSSGTGDLIENG
jgi:hypothetical protein